MEKMKMFIIERNLEFLIEQLKIIMFLVSTLNFILYNLIYFIIYLYFIYQTNKINL